MPSSRKKFMALAGSALALVGIAVWEKVGTEATSEATAFVHDRVLGEFPGTVDVAYVSYQDTTAMFPDGMPESTPASNFWEPWVLENDGALAWRSVIGLTFTGRDSTTVYIDDVRVTIIERRDPPKGLYRPPRGGGDLFERWMSVDLDEMERGPRRSSNLTTDGSWDFPLWVNDNETEFVSIGLEAWTGDYDVEVEVDFHVGDDARTMVVRRDGEPFRLVGPSNADQILQMDYGAPEAYAISPGRPTRDGPSF